MRKPASYTASTAPCPYPTIKAHAAKVMFSDPAIRVEDVAAHLKVSPSTLYRHLPGGRSGLLAEE